MTFHGAEDFWDAVNAAADHYGMRPAFIEKDYWVTYALKNLSRSDEARSTVFKGGTSLSKVYGCINRFSEAPLFTDFDAIWSSIKEQYHSELSQLSWAGSIPGDSEVRAALFQLLEFVRDYGK